MFQGWQRWQGWLEQRCTRSIVCKQLLYNILSFNLIKKVGIIYVSCFVNTWLWISGFSQICQRLSTFVNAYLFMKVIGILEFIVCQYCQPQNVCILFFEDLCRKEELWIHSAIVGCYMSCQAIMIGFENEKNPDVYVLVCLDFSAAWKSTASICYCDTSNIFIQFLYKQIYGCGILFRRWIPLWNFNQYCFCILDGLSL